MLEKVEENGQKHLILGDKILSFKLREGFNPKGKTLPEIRKNIKQIITFADGEEKVEFVYATEPEPTASPVPPMETPTPTSVPTIPLEEVSGV